MPNTPSLGYTLEITCQEAVVVYLNSIRTSLTELAGMADDNDFEGCVLYEHLLAVQSETNKAIRWYLGDDHA